MPAEKFIELVRSILTDHGLEVKDILGITTDEAKVILVKKKLNWWQR